MAETGPSIVPDPVEQVVSAALEATVQTCRRPAVGSLAETYVLELEDDQTVVCKLGGASVWTGDVIEPVVVRLVGSTTDIPVPSVLASGSIRNGDWERRWALYEFCDGSNPAPWYRDATPAVRRRIVADAGSILGRLHAAQQFDRIGGLERAETPTGNELRLCPYDRWHAMSQTGILESVGVNGSPPADCDPVLCHGDFQPGNLLVTETGAITTVLDWGNAHVTHAGYAVARAQAQFVDRFRFPLAERNRLRTLFRDRYRAHASLEAGYVQNASVYKALWLAQSAMNVTHVARTRHGRRQLYRQCRSVWDRN